MKKIRLLTLVVPAYKQEKTIKKDIKSLQLTLSSLSIPYEIIVVVDGEVDKTYEKIKPLESKEIKIYKYTKNEGKGFAIRYGILKGKGDIIGFIDAGMDIDPTGISMLINHMIWYNADVIVGSKLHPVSRVNYPLYRKILSRGYRTLTRVLFGFKVRDTQVGLKLFKRKVVRDVMPRLLVKQYAFDIEMLAVAYSRGYHRIYEAPVKIEFNDNGAITKSKLWKIIFNMLWDTTAVFYRLRILHYYQKTGKNTQLFKKHIII